MLAIGLNFGGWVGGTKWTRTIYHLVVQAQWQGGGGVEGEVALAPPIIHLMLYVSQAQMGLLSKNLVGRAVPQEY